MRGEWLTARQGDETPELSKVPWRDGNGEGEYQPVERQRCEASCNINADTVVDAVDDGMKPSIPGNSQASCGQRRGGSAGRPSIRPSAKH